MRTGNVLFSAVHLFVVLFILGLGLIVLLLPQATEYRLKLADMLLYHPKILTQCGAIILTCGALLLVGFYALNRRTYYTVNLEKTSFATSEKIVKELVLKHWPKLFPEEEFPQDVFLNSKNEIEILLPGKSDLKQQEKFLIKVSEQIGGILWEMIGYQKNIKVSLIA